LAHGLRQPIDHEAGPWRLWGHPLQAVPAFARQLDRRRPLVAHPKLFRAHDAIALLLFGFRRSIPAFPRFANQILRH
jgi:hypothetical protein